MSNRTEGKEYTGDKIITHKDFNPKTLENDIALIHVPEKINYDENVNEIALPDKCQDYVGETCNISGYGHMGKDKPKAKVLQWTQLTIQDDEKCSKLYNHEKFDGSKLCALGKDGRSTCSGDSGGPLVCNDIITGVVSFGKGSCDGKNPSGYTNVCKYYDWIQKHLA